jgi:hypothetical protein
VNAVLVRVTVFMNRGGVGLLHNIDAIRRMGELAHELTEIEKRPPNRHGTMGKIRCISLECFFICHLATYDDVGYCESG